MTRMTQNMERFRRCCPSPAENATGQSCRTTDKSSVGKGLQSTAGVRGTSYCSNVYSIVGTSYCRSPPTRTGQVHTVVGCLFLRRVILATVLVEKTLFLLLVVEGAYSFIPYRYLYQVARPIVTKYAKARKSRLSSEGATKSLASTPTLVFLLLVLQFFSSRHYQERSRKV